MARFVFCKECDGLKRVETEPCEHESTANYSWSGKRCYCDEDNQPNIDMGDYEYDPVAKIRFTKPKLMDYREHKKKLMEDPEFRKAYEALEPEYQARRLLIEEYAEYAEQEIRFCPCCGAALGIEEDEEDLADAEEALKDYTPGEGISVAELHERMRKEGEL